MLTKLHKGTRGISDEGLMRIAKEAKAGMAGEKKAQYYEDDGYDDESFDEMNPDTLVESWMNGNRTSVADLLRDSDDLQLITQVSEMLGEEQAGILQRLMGREASKQAQEEAYEEWSNRPTWLAAFHLDNDYQAYQLVNKAKEESADGTQFVSAIREILTNAIQGDPAMSSDFEGEDMYDINWNEIVDHLMTE